MSRRRKICLRLIVKGWRIRKRDSAERDARYEITSADNKSVKTYQSRARPKGSAPVKVEGGGGVCHARRLPSATGRASGALFLPFAPATSSFTPPVMARTDRELPPGLQTCQKNKHKCVGAPDMPRPRRSSAQVTEEKAKKTEAKEHLSQQQRHAEQRIQDLQEQLAEDAPTVRRPSTRSLAAGTPPSKSLASPNAATSTAADPQEGAY